MESIHPVELFILKLLFCSKLYSGSEYTDTVSTFGFIPLALVVHTCIISAIVPKVIIFGTFIYMYELKTMLKLRYKRVSPVMMSLGQPHDVIRGEFPP